jgi:predicted Zn-ribbon and HTH transcriptional regulator
MTTRNETIIHLYQEDVDIKDICEEFKLSRVSIYNILKKVDILPNRKSLTLLTCKKCGTSFIRKTSLTKTENGGYCSVKCFASARTINPEAPRKSRAGDIARKVLQSVGIVLLPGQVIHHKDGDRNNCDKDNLQIFNSHSEHMKYHHSLIKEL